jgi:hypothetical protein
MYCYSVLSAKCTYHFGYVAVVFTIFAHRQLYDFFAETLQEGLFKAPVCEERERCLTGA